MSTQTVTVEVDPGFCDSIVEAFYVSPTAWADADALLCTGPETIFIALAKDRETEASAVAARRLIGATIASRGEEPDPDLTTSNAAFRAALHAILDDRRSHAIGRLKEAITKGADAARALLRERAALALLGDCWLDMISQPATQPSVIINQLFSQRWRLLGEGSPARALATRRRSALETQGIFLPAIDDGSFAAAAALGPITALAAAYRLALARLPATHLSEVIGLHAVVHVFGLDECLTGLQPPVDVAEAKATLDMYLDTIAHAPDGEARRRRLWRAVRTAINLEETHVALLAGIAERTAGLSLDTKVAEIVRRHAPFAGKQHGRVRVGRQTLSERFADPAFDVAAFLEDFRKSGYTRVTSRGRCRFLDALKLGGPMFGIFTEDEAHIFKAWIDGLQKAVDAPVALSDTRPDETGETASWLDRVRHDMPTDVVIAPTGAPDDRQLFYRLVNIESFPNVLPDAKRRARRGLELAQLLFETGSSGRYTDASWFDYSADALTGRISAIYWAKLVQPYEPLTEIPPRDEVVFGQKVFALGSLIDGSWAFRIGATGRYRSISDAMLFSIYADEMGFGDVRKNHITLIHRVLASLGMDLPHIRDAAFIDQEEIPDAFYAFPLNQLCLGLFPDSFYSEILGYNLGIEMFGLGELRLHEIQKLKHWGFDPIYEEAHLSIDNFSAGHARQSAELIQSHLDQIGRDHGTVAVSNEWRRIWNGYASFAYFAEGGSLDAPPPSLAERPAPSRVVAVQL